VTNTATPVANSPTPAPTATFTPVPPKNVHISLTQITVTGANFNAPDHARVDGTTVTTALSYQGASGTITNAASITTWTLDQANAKATSSGTFAPVVLTDKHLTMALTTTITIPFVDPASPALVVTFTRTITPEEYAAGGTIASPVLSNAKIPGYSVTLVLVDSLS
jgi:hypothetical protein